MILERPCLWQGPVHAVGVSGVALTAPSYMTTACNLVA
jgi:hypothetical protein